MRIKSIKIKKTSQRKIKFKESGKCATFIRFTDAYSNWAQYQGNLAVFYLGNEFFRI